MLSVESIEPMRDLQGPASDGSTLTAQDTQAWDAEASAIADAIARAMAGASEYTGVMSIHVDYLDAGAGRATPARTFVFNRTPAGSFARHSS